MKASRVLLIMICLVTSLVFGILYVYRYVFEKDITPASASITGAYADKAEGERVTEAAPVLPAVTYSALPRIAYTYDGVSVGVTGTKGMESLLDYYAFGGHVYVILSTDTDGDDYRAEGVCLAVARFDDGCTLLDTVTLPKSAGYTYLSACMYDYGLVVAAASLTDLRVWTVSTNLTVRTAAYPYVVQAAEMVYDKGAVVLVASGDKLHALSIGADLQTLWYYATPIGTQSVAALYTYGDAYVVLCSDLSAGSAYTVDAAGYRSRAVLPAVSAVTPYAGGYAIASRVDSCVYFVDYTFARTGVLPLFSFDAVRLCSYDKGVVCIADRAGYLLCNHGDVQYTFTLSVDPASPVIYIGGSFYFASASASGASIYAYRPFTAAPVVTAEYVGASAPRFWPSKGYLYCLCTSTFDYGYYAGAIGARDVYLLRSALPSV